MRFAEFGEPSAVLAAEAVPVPEPGHGEVLLRMRARPVNPSDLSLPRAAEELLALGADAVLVPGRDDLAARVGQVTGGTGVRAAIDAVGGALGGEVAAALAEGGVLVSQVG